MQQEFPFLLRNGRRFWIIIFYNESVLCKKCFVQGTQLKLPTKNTFD